MLGLHRHFLPTVSSGGRPPGTMRPGVAPSFSLSTPPAAVAPDSLLYLRRVFRKVLVDLLVREIEVAQDPVVQRLRLRLILAGAALQQRLQHGRAQDRILPALAWSGHGQARRGETSTVWRPALDGSLDRPGGPALSPGVRGGRIERRR